jgi:hypothetical protein
MLTPELAIRGFVGAVSIRSAPLISADVVRPVPSVAVVVGRLAQLWR